MNLPIPHLGQSQFLPIQLHGSLHPHVNGVFSLHDPWFEQPGDLIHSSQFDPFQPNLHLTKKVY